MVGVVSTKYRLIKFWPCSKTIFGLLLPQTEGMARRTYANNWLTRLDIPTNSIELLWWQCSSADTHKQEICRINCLATNQFVGLIWICVDKATFFVTYILLTKIRECLFRLVLSLLLRKQYAAAPHRHVLSPQNNT